MFKILSKIFYCKVIFPDHASLHANYNEKASLNGLLVELIMISISWLFFRSDKLREHIKNRHPKIAEKLNLYKKGDKKHRWGDDFKQDREIGNSGEPVEKTSEGHGAVKQELNDVDQNSQAESQGKGLNLKSHTCREFKLGLV